MPQKLKRSYPNAEAIPDGQKEFYQETNGTFYLVYEKDQDESKLDEFRRNNRELTAEKEKLEKQFGGLKNVPIEKIQELQDLQSRLENDEDMKLVQLGKLDVVLDKRFGPIKSRLEQERNQLNEQLTREKEARNKDSAKLRDLLIDQEISNHVTNIGSPATGAMTDILRRARDKFTVDEDYQVVSAPNALDAEGKPLTPESYARNLVREAPFLFEKSIGGGAGGNNGNQPKKARGVTYIPNDLAIMAQHEEGIRNGTVKIDNNLRAE